MFGTILSSKTIRVLLVLCIYLASILVLANVALSVPEVTITLIPHSGNGPNTWADRIEGTVSDVEDFGSYKIAIYVLGDMWYIQPYAGDLIDIRPDGEWITGTRLGTRYAALLVKASYEPPSGMVILPSIGGDIVAVTMVAPILVTPESGAVGDLVTITMDPEGPFPDKDFGNEQGTSKVTFDGVDAGQAETWEDDEIEVRVPAGAADGPVEVTVGEQTWIGTIHKRVYPDPTQPGDTTFTATVTTTVMVCPGDTNNDGIVDARDVLRIGIYWGKNGPKRENGIGCVSQPAPAGWEPPEAARADANGDGVIDGRDVLVIGMCWGNDYGDSCRAPMVASIFSRETDRGKHGAAYEAMLYTLETDPLGKDASELKRVLHQLILLARSESPTLQNRLGQNFPNPFNPETWIPYELAEDSEVNIRIYNTSGRLVRAISLGYREKGRYLSKDKAAYWDGRDPQGEPVASGVYFYQLEAGDFRITRKLVVEH